MRRLLAALLLLLPGAARAYRLERLTRVGGLALGTSIDVVSEEALVKFAVGVSSDQRASALAGVGAAAIKDFPDIGWTWVRMPPGMRVANAMQLLKTLPEVAEVSPNHAQRPNVVPNDAFVSQQASLSQVNAFAGWEFETGVSNAVTIAFIDTGIDATQQDLAGKLLDGGANARSQDCSSGACADTQNPPTPACNHATRTSGIAAAATNNGAGIAGISWGAKLVSLKVFPDGFCNPAGDCPGGCVATDASVIAALGYVRTKMTGVAAAGKLVVNMSIGGAGGCPAAVGAEMALDVAAGITLVASAGNDSGAVNQPANCAGAVGGSGIIPVGAVDVDNNIAYFSSRGPELAANGVVAPGVNVVTTDIANGYAAAATGTSFSAPHVSGLAALVLSAKPAFTPAQVQSVIRGGCDNIGIASLNAAASSGSPLGTIAGAGRVDNFRSLRLAVRGTLADFIGDQKAIAFPNPFRISSTGAVAITIPVSLQGANALVKVYTSDGRLVRTLKGLTWDGRSDGGNVVASGTYVFFVSTDNGSTTGRLAVIR
ncbi:MAG: S8 family serine peptidase [Elusimicrobia bacterium]|nr:S8 family serine peptidase [Elusimicrobiota bacterium]